MNESKNAALNTVSAKDQLPEHKLVKTVRRGGGLKTDNFRKRPTLDVPFYEAAKENGYIFCSIGDIENDERSMALGEYEHRGVSIHPSDYGMELIARRIVGCL